MVHWWLTGGIEPSLTHTEDTVRCPTGRVHSEKVRLNWRELTSFWWQFLVKLTHIFTTMAVTNKKFARRSKVILKKEKAPAIFRDVLGKRKWKVELVDPENGKSTGAFLNLSSQMMRHPKQGKFPADDIDESSSKEQEDTEAANQGMEAALQGAVIAVQPTDLSSLSSASPVRNASRSSGSPLVEEESDEDPDEDGEEDLPAEGADEAEQFGIQCT